MIDTLLTIGLIMVLVAVGIGLLIFVAWIATVCWYDAQQRRMEHTEQMGQMLRRENLAQRAAEMKQEAIDKAIREEEERDGSD